MKMYHLFGIFPTGLVNCVCVCVCDIFFWFPSQIQNYTILIESKKFQWPNSNEIYPAIDSTMGQLLYALQHEEIIAARNAPKGTQMKLLLHLTGKQKVIFKPKWYERNAIIDGPVYAGKDRFNAEIVGFYLGAMLNLRWTPIAVGRQINLKEIYDKLADKSLRSTMTVNGTEKSRDHFYYGNSIIFYFISEFSITDDQSEYCVYGKCYYCKDTETICGDENHLIEGVVLYLVPGTLEKQRSPWQRTYKDNQLAPWEESMDFCVALKERTPHVRLLDLIDASVFDFLMQNGDRHHYETRNDRVVLIDNGKGFGNPNVDFIDILAPLYQCCV